MSRKRKLKSVPAAVVAPVVATTPTAPIVPPSSPPHLNIPIGVGILPNNLVCYAVKKVHESATIPAYQSAHASGVDIAACLDAGPVTIDPGKSVLVPTGLVFDLPLGTELQIRSRSGLAAQHGIFVLNSPGTVDSDFRGEVKVILTNLGDKPFAINNGDRIAQAVLQLVPGTILINAPADAVFSLTDRGNAGFGSSGVK